MAGQKQKEKRAGQRGGGRSGGGDRGGDCQPPDGHDLVTALGHRTRRLVLRRLHGSDEPLSPAGISRMVGMRVPNLSYHVKILRGCCVVKLVSEEQVRGAVEHFYESRVADNELALEVLSNTRAKDEDGA